MMKVLIFNMGCDDMTELEFELEEKEVIFLESIFELLNKKSTYGCMPKIKLKRLEL